MQIHCYLIDYETREYNFTQISFKIIIIFTLRYYENKLKHYNIT